MGNLSQRVGFDEERTTAAPFTGSAQTVGTPLTEVPTIIIFDNESDVSVELSVDGGLTTWKTFAPGTAIILDLRANHGTAPNYSIDLGTQFSVTGTGGTGLFSIALTYAR